MARGEKSDSGRRPASKRSSKSGKDERQTRRSRARSGGYAGAGAAGAGTKPAEAKSNRGAAASRRRMRSSPTGNRGHAAPSSERIDFADDAARGFLPPDLDEEMEGGERESLEEAPSEFDDARAQRREELDTDGPVIGGPGMVRLGGDRAVSSRIGGLAAGEDLDPVAEGDYWRENFRRSPYFAAETEERYEPAYRFGWTRAGQYEYRNRGFEEVEVELRREWEGSAESDQPWDDAREAARDAWESARDRE